DPASIDLLDALLRRPPTAPALLALALRPRQSAGRLTSALDRAHRSGTLVRVELGPLSLADVQTLLGGAVEGAQVSVLYEESGGNPFYLEQLARSAGERTPTTSHASGIALADVDVPSAVAASLSEELGLLSEAARLVLQGAAVSGDPFELDLAAA